MATNTLRLGLRKPATTDLVTVGTDLDANFDILDNAALVTLANAFIAGSNKFGVGAAGAVGSYVDIGHYDNANAYIQANGSTGVTNLLVRSAGGTISIGNAVNEGMQVNPNTGVTLIRNSTGTAITIVQAGAGNQTALSVWCWGPGAIRTVETGAVDSGGAGFRQLRVPN